MPQSLVKILVHVVFSTKGRLNLITSEIEAELFAYIAGVIEKNGGRLIIGGGTKNHIHLLISVGRVNIKELIGDIKRDSSNWVKRRFPLESKFYWQRGYGAFSIGQSQTGSVSQYIRNQQAHHAGNNLSFEDEFREICARYEVEIDERYCWD